MVHDISDLPEELRAQTAAWVEHSSLPALRLVSRGWNEAANLAVRQLKRHDSLWPAQELEMRLIGQRWPNLERLELDEEDALVEPDEDCRQLMASLTPLTRLQHLSLGMGAALLPEGQECILRQTRLLSLRTICIRGEIGASDGLLQVISRLSHLTRLECDLQAERENLAEGLPQLEPATDEGLRCLSSLRALQDLTLPVSAHGATVTGQALSTVGSLHQLTHLSLEGWPMVYTDLGQLTHLQLVSLELRSGLNLTSGCTMHLSLITSLCFLNLERAGNWFTEEDMDPFEEFASGVMPHLTRLRLSTSTL